MLAELARIMRADRSLLFSLAPRPEHGRLWVGHEVPPEALVDYASYYHERDVLLQTAVEQSRFHAGRAIADETLMPKHCFRSSEYYQDFFQRIGILHTCSGIVFDQEVPSGIPPALLVFYRRPERPAFTPEDERLVELFIPHLQRAVQIAVQMDGARMLSAVREKMFEASPYAMAVCSRDGQLLYANSRMERILREQDGLTYREGRVTVLRERGHEAFLRALAACAGPPCRRRSARGCVPHPSALGQERLRRPRAPFARLGPVARSRDPSRGVASDHRSCRGPAGRDRDPATALSRPLPEDTPKEASERFQVTQNTIRTQLKSVLAKTGARRQVDLVLLVNRLAPAA